MRTAIEAKLGGASLRSTEASPLIEKGAGGRVAVPPVHLLRLGDGRFDRGREFMCDLIKRRVLGGCGGSRKRDKKAGMLVGLVD